ncbi:hypothetical protein ACLB2K_063354 [Fragaria x ananassa]
MITKGNVARMIVVVTRQLSSQQTHSGSEQSERSVHTDNDSLTTNPINKGQFAHASQLNQTLLAKERTNERYNNLKFKYEKALAMIQRKETTKHFTAPANSAQSHTPSPSPGNLTPKGHQDKEQNQVSFIEGTTETTNNDSPKILKICTKVNDPIALLLHKFEELKRRVSKQEASPRGLHASVHFEIHPGPFTARIQCSIGNPPPKPLKIH